MRGMGSRDTKDVANKFALLVCLRKNVNTFSLRALNQTDDYFSVPEKVEGLRFILETKENDHRLDGHFPWSG